MNIVTLSVLLFSIFLPTSVWGYFFFRKTFKKRINQYRYADTYMTNTVFIPSVVVAVSLISLIILNFGKAEKTNDSEIWNGQIISKYRETVPCDHSYQCNCVTTNNCSGSGSTYSCYSQTICQTCYEHPHDYDWVLNTSIGKINIDRVDSQGVITPNRWTIAKIGEPVAQRHIFTNLVKGAQLSLFNSTEDQVNSKFKTLIPTYPDRVYDYYRINRALAVGVKVPDLEMWNTQISDILRYLGPKKQANIIVLFVNTNDPKYELALKQAWLNGKKNDVVIILGTTHYPKLDFVRIMSWTDNQMFKIQLRDQLSKFENIDRNAFMQIINDETMKDFKRKHMKDFKYLENEIYPDTWAIILAMLWVIFVTVVGAYFALKNR
jgi:hypothetical protein